MRRFFYCLFLLFVVTGCHTFYYTASPGPILTSINIIDRNGFSETISNSDRLSQYCGVDFLQNQPYQKVLRVYARDEMGDIRAHITSYHPNGQVRQSLEVVNNRACGNYQEWYSNGQLKIEGTVIAGEADIDAESQKTWMFDGMSRAWDDAGHLLAEIPYFRGELEGITYYYHTSGSVWKKVPYCKGNLDGMTEIFLEDGSLLQTITHLEGEKHGCSTRYWSKDVIASEEHFYKNRLERAIYFDSCGKELSRIEQGNGFRVVFGKHGVSEMHEYQHGLAEGEVRVFLENGTLARIYHVKNGLKNGEEIEYYLPFESIREKQPKLSVQWIEGKVQGLAKTWYPNGRQESQREMNNNKKHGLLTAWYGDGSIMLLEEYDQDKLNTGEYFSPGENTPASEVKNGKGTATLFDSKGNLKRKISYYNGKPVP